ncbi:meiotic coiled-coil protein 7 [Culex quinquefasciatus]|uniref:Meiotic nuclear division protein 1 homolog n=1 Tax=Culex quinquefasciatus TaxID=7176 RepID=B0X6B0_CULQU|nr:meiotic coiled-coil protein 7 [Culex quinquefasciatus]|eukprot:XP_001865182.1 meiotic coiled-coil protein 7 [Culex quinquefasciatus]
MSKRKKGMSADEKRSVLLEIFHESGEFYQLKDLERIAAKEKGLKEQLVKGLLQSLEDEGLVEVGKIGQSTFYWSFPGKRQKIKQLESEELQRKVENCDAKIEDLRRKVEEAKNNQAQSLKAAATFEELKVFKEKEAKLQAEIQSLKKDDKGSLKQMKQSLPKLHEAANRWTDNIFAIKSWCRNKFNIEEKAIDKQFQIPPDMDYLE